MQLNRKNWIADSSRGFREVIVSHILTMPYVNEITLALAIQAIDFKMADLEKKLDAAPPDRGADLEELLLSYSNAAEALKRAYQEALTEVDNLPTYESLVRGSD